TLSAQDWTGTCQHLSIRPLRCSPDNLGERVGVRSDSMERHYCPQLRPIHQLQRILRPSKQINWHGLTSIIERSVALECPTSLPSALVNLWVNHLRLPPHNRRSLLQTNQPRNLNRHPRLRWRRPKLEHRYGTVRNVIRLSNSNQPLYWPT